MLDSLRDTGTAVPALSRTVLNNSLCFLFIPIPWFIYGSVLGSRRELSTDAVFAFSGTLFLAVAFLGSVAGLAFVLPWLPVKIGLK